MHFTLALILPLLLLLPSVASRPEAAAACVQNACLSVVSSSRVPTPSISPWGCLSFFRTTVTPMPFTQSITVTQFARQTTTLTATLTVTASTPVTRTTTNTIVNVLTQTTTTTVVTEGALATTTTPYLTTETQTGTTTRYTSRTTMTSTITVDPNGSTIKKRAPLATTACPAPSTKPSTLPAYASVCKNTVAYSSACSCISAAHGTTTLPRCTTTSTFTKTVTSVITNKQTVTTTRTVPGSVISMTSTTTTQRTQQVTPTSTVTQTYTYTVFTPTTTSKTIYNTIETDTTVTVTTTVTQFPSTPSSFYLRMSSPDGTYDNEPLAATTWGYANQIRALWEILADPNPTSWTDQFGLDSNSTFLIGDGSFWFAHQYDEEVGGGSIYGDPLDTNYGQPYNALMCSISSSSLACSSIGNTVWSYCMLGSANKIGIGLFLGVDVPTDCVEITLNIFPYP